VIAAGRLARSPRRQWVPRLGTMIAVLMLALLLGGAWLWLRDSALVSVRHVVVQGDTGPDQGPIRSALTGAARNMTTLHVRLDQLRTAVAPYPVVKDLQVSVQFPHGLRIRVVEQIPVGAISAAARLIAVAGDGTLLRDVPAGSLPTIPLRVPPGGTKLSEPHALGELAVLAAAPYPMLARISQVSTIGGHGLVAQLRSGLSIVFGDTGRLAAKWTAATAVLGDSGSAGAAYIDVTEPARPAAGVTPARSGVASGAGAAAASASGISSATAAGTGTAATSIPGG
jgi:cell division protein FtsQ